jgi:integrase
MARWGVFDLTVWQTILSSVAPSTKKEYEKIFWDFVSFFDERECSFDSIQIDLVLSFLQKFVGLSTSRVRTAVAAMKMFLRVYKRQDLADHPLLNMFAKGAQNLAPLPKEKPSIWNPETVLEHLKKTPRPSSFFPCAHEALILLLLATGWRVDDVWKLNGRIEFSGETMVVFFREKRKCKIKGKHTLSRTISRFRENERVCPVVAMERYLSVCQKLRKNDSFLFVSSLGVRASKDTLRRWARDLLLKCGISASAGSCRSAATSSALARNWPLDQIMQSAGWSSETTFRKFYDRKVLPVDVPLNLLHAK